MILYTPYLVPRKFIFVYSLTVHKPFNYIIHIFSTYTMKNTIYYRRFFEISFKDMQNSLALSAEI